MPRAPRHSDVDKLKGKSSSWACMSGGVYLMGVCLLGVYHRRASHGRGKARLAGAQGLHTRVCATFAKLKCTRTRTESREVVGQSSYVVLKSLDEHTV